MENHSRQAYIWDIKEKMLVAIDINNSPLYAPKYGNIFT
jgi:hypothetical protein